MSLVVVGLSHQSCPVEVRERFAFSEDAIPGVLGQLVESGLAQEAVLVSTCNRVELYAATGEENPAAVKELKGFLIRASESSAEVDEMLYGHVEPHSLSHLFRVVCGLDSMVLGETEILGQMKRAYDVALNHRHTGPDLNRAFQKAFNVAKHVRTETSIQRGNISVASVAVDLAGKIFSELKGRRVMVIGAGDTSEKTARALVSRGCSDVLVSNRSFDRAEALASLLGGRAIEFSRWEEEFADVDIVISSTAATSYVLDRPRLEKMLEDRRRRELLLIDIAVPRDIDPEVNHMEDVYLYNVDDLQAIAEDYLEQRKQEATRCEGIIETRVAALLKHLHHARKHSGR